MVFIKRGKKAELTSSQIITIVLAIAGFIVVLIFLALLFEDRGDKRELCKFSVLTRATSPIGSLQASIPLKCTTEKICISDSGKKDACKQFAGENKDVKSVKLKGSVDEKARQIEETSAKAMFDCWNMMGQGKLEIFSGTDPPKSTIGGVFDVIGDFLRIPDIEGIKPTCVICSRVALADDLLEKDDKGNFVHKEVLEKVDVNRYLGDKFIPGSETQKYIDYFVGSEQARGFYDDEFFEQGLVLESRDKKGNEVFEFKDEKGNVLEQAKLVRPEPTDQMAFVFMQVLTEKDPIKAAADAGTSTAFVFAGLAIGTPFGTALNAVSFLPRVGIALATVGLTAGFSYFRQRANQQLAAGYCGEFTKEGRESKGCSLLKPVDYNDIRQINDLCYILEGNP